MRWTIPQKRLLTNFSRNGWSIPKLANYFGCNEEEIIIQLEESEGDKFKIQMTTEDLMRKAYMDRLYPNRENPTARKMNAFLRMDERDGDESR